jgi:hypothetical protein
MLTDTISDICTGVCTEASTGGLEVNASFDFRQVAASKISGASNEIGEGRDD